MHSAPVVRVVGNAYAPAWLSKSLDAPKIAENMSCPSCKVKLQLSPEEAAVSA